MAEATPAEKSYLASVDGLRALSILAVVGFHLKLPGFSGGFIGVDVFFVISGFLIINQIRGELEQGRFSLLAFFMRRGLRILPAFMLMLAVVNVAAYFILPSPEVNLDFLFTALASPLMLSNVLFYLRQGYFDLVADQKPLLHTWTLSVEEQFYFAAPFLLMLLFRLERRLTGATIVLATAFTAVSLAGTIAQTFPSGRNPAFYLPHFRAWEFIAGGLIAPTAVNAVRRIPRWAIEILGGAGLLLIIGAVLRLDPTMAYPSYFAAIPVFGAFLAILAAIAQPRIVAARILSLRSVVAIGLVSYGWYLWHWPILSFIRIVYLDQAPMGVLVAGALLALILAYGSYHFIEEPIRRWRSRVRSERPGLIVAAGSAACLTAAAVGGLMSLNGYFSANALADSRYQTQGRGVRDNGCRILTSSVLPESCTQGKIVMLLGDSYADALSGAFTRRLSEESSRLVTLARGGCHPILFAPSQRSALENSACRNLLAPFVQLLASPNTISGAIVTSAWSYGQQTTEQLADLLSQFPKGVRILIIGPVPTFTHSALDCVILSDRFGQDRARCGRPRSEIENDRATITRNLDVVSRQSADVRYVDPIDLFCGTAACTPYKGDMVFFRDQGHALPSGAHFIYDAFSQEMRWLTEPRPTIK